MTGVRRKGMVAALLSAGALVAAGVVLVETRGAQSVWDGVFAESQADRGRTLYREWCEGCHAPDLSGGKVVPGLAGRAFTDKWQGVSIGRLFELTMETMPEEDPRSVSPRQKADILAFVLRENGFPAGSRDLPPHVRMLDRYSFTTAEPRER